MGQARSALVRVCMLVCMRKGRVCAGGIRGARVHLSQSVCYVQLRMPQQQAQQGQFLVAECLRHLGVYGVGVGGRGVMWVCVVWMCVCVCVCGGGGSIWGQMW